MVGTRWTSAVFSVGLLLAACDEGEAATPHEAHQTVTVADAGQDGALAPVDTDAGFVSSSPDSPLSRDCANYQPTLHHDEATATGGVTRWLESSDELTFDEGPAWPTWGHDLAPEALRVWWSMADYDTAYFYAPGPGARVAHAEGFDHITDIQSAADLDYKDWAIGPFEAGAIVVYQHLHEDRYLAVQVDAVYATDLARKYDWGRSALDATWAFARAGSDDFSAAP